MSWLLFLGEKTKRRRPTLRRGAQGQVPKLRVFVSRCVEEWATYLRGYVVSQGLYLGVLKNGRLTCTPRGGSLGPCGGGQTRVFCDFLADLLFRGALETVEEDPANGAADGAGEDQQHRGEKVEVCVVAGAGAGAYGDRAGMADCADA
eukprot:Hpha_TRINITY_DN13327_c0_g3::TRINITY_DN13327_c0_g3_i1::g.95636::m.95636